MPKKKNTQNNVMINEIVRNISSAMELFMTNLRKIDFSKLVNNFIIPLESFAEELEKAKNNPESLINYLEYVKKISYYFWAMPYKIDGKSLKNIFDNVNSEKEFDSYMLEYFTDEKIKGLFNDIRNKVSQKHKDLFEQITKSFENGYYALINIALIAIIDDELSFYLKDKKTTTRKNIFKQILKKLKRVPIQECNYMNIIILEMLDNNINIIFENIYFDNISITTEKITRRHPTQHGVIYSKEKKDSIMLINTLYNILYTRDYLLMYENKLSYSRKEEKFSCEKVVQNV